ncbi:DUF2061 domain-containing protein [Teredinibacter haidensis]|uniref:DUF2061 domain-containing protein n=1 Tax=Teredinibacter haidensis TaxID=2731755 RepID=UPI000948F433|nr:DUF2061 domain-containing protein [Teredinibacter haidensis]
MIKSLTFTAMHFVIAFSVAWALTGDWAVGGIIALVEPAVNSVGYFFHEKVWEKIKRGEDWRGVPLSV